MDEEIILYLPSNSSGDYFDNTIARYVTKLAQPITLSDENNYKVGLCELILPKSAIVAGGDLYLYCDLCSAQFVGDSQARLLRIIRVDKQRENYEFAKIYYHRLEKYHFSVVEILLADKNGDRFNFSASSDPSIVVLSIIKS